MLDNRMLGSLTAYRRLLREHVFAPRLLDGTRDPSHILPSYGHGMAGMLAGWTVSFIAAPVEHVKARLQVQYAVDKRKRIYSGPIDCTQKLVGMVIQNGNPEGRC
jgi:solute carrier family 25 (mitochondrial carnitine/acylcarnitine transporter), member 20/29